MKLHVHVQYLGSRVLWKVNITTVTVQCRVSWWFLVVAVLRRFACNQIMKTFLGLFGLEQVFWKTFYD